MSKLSNMLINILGKKQLHLLRLFVWLVVVASGMPTYAQKTIQLKNPSFEDKPAIGKAPSSWKNCGFKGESPPDVQPCGAFEVTTLASDGNTYLGLVTRDNDTWEKVGTKLSRKMKAGIVYEFKIQLTRSAQYQSASRLTNKAANFITPVVLRIYGGHSFCEKEQLLGLSPSIEHTDWQTYRFTLSPEEAYSHLLLEVYYADPLGEAYCGNLLVDHASPLIPLGESATIAKASLLAKQVRE